MGKNNKEKILIFHNKDYRPNMELVFIARKHIIRKNWRMKTDKTKWCNEGCADFEDCFGSEKIGG
jgi:hypothetical protein